MRSRADSRADNARARPVLTRGGWCGPAGCARRCWLWLSRDLGGERARPPGRTKMTNGAAVEVPASSLRKMLVPLALAQFICSFAGSNMNVMINDISRDLHTDVQGVQVCITLFLLVMAALMIPCGKLTDRYGRKRLFELGLMVYGVGRIICARAAT